MSWNGGFSRLEGIGRFAQDRHDGSPWRALTAAEVAEVAAGADD